MSVSPDASNGPDFPWEFGLDTFGDLAYDPAFGYDLDDYETLFEEKTALFAELLKGGPVTWSGTTRAALENADVVSHLEHGPFPVWIGVGGSPESVVRAARHGFALMLAIIGGPPAHVAATDALAIEQIWPHYRAVVTKIGRIRGWPPPTREQFLREVGPDGAWCVGSPETVARKIAANMPALGATRFDLKYGLTGLPHDAVMTCIALFGTEVVPRLRALLAEQAETRSESMS